MPRNCWLIGQVSVLRSPTRAVQAHLYILRFAGDEMRTYLVSLKKDPETSLAWTIKDDLFLLGMLFMAG